MKRGMPQNIQPILDEVKAILGRIYGDRLEGVILYGSHARGDAVEGSDIDLIVLLKDMDDAVSELERCSKEIHELDLMYDTLISIIPLDIEDYRTRRLPVILNATKEGIPL
jgi:predicted nucleotidyltransferase